jgi:hypothetical protein
MLTMLGSLHCAVVPSEDCSEKATCTSAVDATAETTVGPRDAGDASVTPEAESSGNGDDGGADDTGLLDTGPVDAGPPVACDGGFTCVPPVPDGWNGPFAQWQGAPTSAPPACPAGYGWPADTNYGLNAPPLPCTCSCVSTGQECLASATMYTDMGCASVCATASVGACAAVTPVGSGCGQQGSLRVETPTPTPGTCEPNVQPNPIPNPTWNSALRVCQMAASEINWFCPTSGEVCTQIPAAPYGARVCVEQVVQEGQPVPATCPATYPNRLTDSYWTYADGRGCAQCACADGGPAGGSCKGSVAVTGAAVDDCTTGANPFPLGTVCGQFGLAGNLARIAGTYELEAGTCAVATDTHAYGTAQATGSAQVVCCM